MGKIDAKLIEVLGSSIDQLPERSTKTPYEIVAHLAPAISAALARGQDMRVIAKLLKHDGVNLAPRTVANYLRRAQNQVATRPRSEERAAAVERPEVSAHVVTTRETEARDSSQRGREPAHAPGHFPLVPDTQDL